MANELEIYRDWLGITETARPLNHYQFLRLKQFDDDAAKVRERLSEDERPCGQVCRRRICQRSQDCSTELAKAMLCLTDQPRKGDYDASLGRTGRRRERRPDRWKRFCWPARPSTRPNWKRRAVRRGDRPGDARRPGATEGCYARM